MKYKIAKDKSKRPSRLIATSDKGAKLAYSAAEYLHSKPSRSIMSLSYKEAGAKLRFQYPLENCLPFADSLASELSKKQFLDILEEVLALADFCEKDKELKFTSVVFDPEYVFVDEDMLPLFAYLPLKNPRRQKHSVLDFFEFLAEKALFVDKDDAFLSVALSDWVNRQNTFSRVEFRRFLGEVRKELGGEFVDERPERQFVAHILPEHSGFDFVAYVAGTTLEEQTQTQTMGTSSSDSSSLSQRTFLIRVNDGAVFELSTGETKLGRSADADIQISGDTGVSRLHAMIQVASTVCTITDLASSNGTMVDGKRIASYEPVDLGQNSEFSIGAVTFRIQKR